MTRTAQLSGVLLLALSCLLPGCLNVQRLKNADPYVIHHHNWWNYYQRGRLYVQDEKFQAAQSDFQTALGQIPGARLSYAKESWRARTYGMHLIEGYFPHRELGICLFEQQQFSEALELLEFSIQMEPSARAKFYINQVHAALARASTPPRIEINTLSGWTPQRALSFQGTVEGPNPIVALAINGEQEFIELATSHRPFLRKLALKEGRNVIPIVATDVADNQTTTNLIISADWTPPEIHLHRAGSSLTITCTDNLGLNQLEINERIEYATSNEHTLTHPLIAGEPLHVTASDHAGNRITWSLSKKEIQHLAQPSETGPPRLHVTNADKTITLYNPEYVLDLRADDDTALETVQLNGVNLLTQITPLFRTMRRIPLELGYNRFELMAEDTDGNQTSTEITVRYRQPEYRDRIYRLATALAPLEGEIPDITFKRRVNHLIGHELTLDPVRFNLLADIDETSQLLSEQSLSDSELSDPRALLKQGEKLDADLVFFTRVLSDGAGYTIYTQVLDTRSGDELFVEDVYLEDLHHLPNQLSGLVMKLEQHFPLIQACLQQQDRRLVIDAGAMKGAQKGMRFLVIRSSGTFEQGRVILTENRPVELIISEVESARAQVIVPNGQSKHTAQPGDFVFSR
ncbi:MAG: hypothetical protein V3V05_01010 [Pontiella sp.]